MEYHTYRTWRRYGRTVEDVEGEVPEGIPEGGSAGAPAQSFSGVLHAWGDPLVNKLKRILAWAGWVVAAVQGVLSQLPQ